MDDLKSVSNLSGRARESERRHDWPEALRCWLSAQLQFPENAEAHVGAAAAMMQVDRLEEAEAVLDTAVARFPRHREALNAHARVAHRRRDWAETLCRWQRVRDAFGDDVDSLCGAAAALAQLDRTLEADSMLAPALKQNERSVALAITYASAAQRRGDWPETLRRWQYVRERFPENAEGHCGVERALRKLDRAEEADAVALAADLLLEAAASASGDRPDPALQYARAADYRGNWSKALPRWEAMRARFPDNLHGYIGTSRALQELRRFAEAEPVLAAATERFPGVAQLAIDYAELAHYRRDWTEALRRWQQVRVKFDGGLFAADIGEAYALRESGRGPEAQEILLGAIARFPQRPVLATYWQAEQRFRESTEAVLSRYLTTRAMQRIYDPWKDIPVAGARIDLHQHAAHHIGCDTPVRYLEFGVAGGDSIRGFAARFKHPGSRFTGFDSFEGLPEAWLKFDPGTFSTGGRIPKLDDARVDFVKGWFQNTLSAAIPGFAGEQKTVLVHYDADIYSATLFLLSMLWDVIPDYFFIMDEFPSDEVRALYDFSLAYPVSIQLLAKTQTRTKNGWPEQVFGRITRRELVLG